MSEVVQRTKEDAQAVATSLGLVCFFPEPNEIFLDFDGIWGVRLSVMECLNNNGFQVLDKLVTKSRDGNQHDYLRIDQNITHHERVCLQACLGSDPVKEALSVIRLIQDPTSASAIALFETPEWAEEVKEWRAKTGRGEHLWEL